MASPLDSTTLSALVVGVALVLLGSGCPPEPPPVDPTPMRLADVESWVRVTDPGIDVFADQRPADASCDDAGYFYDPFAQSLEIETELCNYLTVAQPSLAPLNPGDVVTIHAFHDVLTAPEAAEGYLGLAIGGELEWEFHVAIPSDVGVIEEEFTIDRALPAGTDLQFHVHNHGPNTWELIAIMVTP
jgi:hypothetical protein